MNGLDELRGDGRMIWSEAEQGWVAAPEEIVNRLPLSQAVVFITVDGASLSDEASSPGSDPHRDDGGEA
jgi:hypothetical protein